MITLELQLMVPGQRCVYSAPLYADILMLTLSYLLIEQYIGKMYWTEKKFCGKYQPRQEYSLPGLSPGTVWVIVLAFGEIFRNPRLSVCHLSLCPEFSRRFLNGIVQCDARMSVMGD